MKLNKRSKKFLVSLSILLGGCAPTVQPLDRVEDQNQFLQQVAKANPQIKTLKAKAKVEVVTKGRSYSFKAGIMMTSGAQLFLETYGLGVPAGYLSLSNDKLTAVIPSQKEEYVGTGSSPFTKILKINTTMNELFDPILKKIIIMSEDAQPKIETSGQHYVIRDQEKTDFYVNGAKWIDRIERRMGFLVEYGDPISDKIRFPKTVKLSYEHQSIYLDFYDVVIDQPIPYESFQINMPTEGYKVYSVE